MNKTLKTNTLILLGGLLSALLFTYQGYGWNVLLFTAFLAFLTYRKHPAHPYVWLATGNLLVLALLWVALDTQLIRTTYTLALWVFIGVVQAPFLRFLWFSSLLGVASLVTAPWYAGQQSLRLRQLRSKPVLYWSAMLLIPLVLLATFFTLYAQASSVFASWFGHWEKLGVWLQEHLRPSPYVLFAVPGLLLTTSLLTPLPWLNRVRKIEARWLDHLVRRRRRVSRSFPMLGLKREYLVGLISLAGLNGLLLLVNMTDVYSLWLGRVPRTPQALSEYVHAGTGYLILSILMAVLIVLVLFRGNLNFFPGAGWLRRLAHLWIVQNAFLTISVGLRNGFYAHTYGLTYLRIGLFFFLVLVLWGLLTLAWKITRRHTAYRLVSNNALGWLIAFTLLASMPWDNIITRYNLQEVRREYLDARHLLHLASAKNLSLLKDHRGALLTDGYYSDAELDEALRQKQQRLNDHWASKGPLGWTLHPR